MHPIPEMPLSCLLQTYNKKKFKEIESACIEKSKQYDWEITSKNLNKIYESLV